jgi:hypothetical protein
MMELQDLMGEVGRSSAKRKGDAALAGEGEKFRVVLSIA